MCEAHLNDGPLACTRKDPHETGHVFKTGSYVNDRHDEGGHG